MGYPHGCCCCGGCNVWRDVVDNSPCLGFGDATSCQPVDCVSENQGGRCGEYGEFGNSWQECCGPATPDRVSFTANTHWAFAWHRDPQSLSCMGGGAPEGNYPHVMPTGKWGCIGQPNDYQVAVWGTGAGSPGLGAWWIDAGAIGMTLIKDNETAAGTHPDDGGANFDHPVGCCAHHYYGKVNLGGPETPALDTNPWGYEVADYANATGDYERIPAPTHLEAFGHLALETGGWSTTSDPDSPPTIVMRATLSIYVALRGVANHFVDLTSTNPAYWSSALGLVTYSSAEVGGCSCGSGIDLVEGLDWTNPADGSWSHKWEYPSGHQATDTINYTNSPGSCTGPPYCCGAESKGNPWDCSLEAFTLTGYEGASSNAPLGCQKSWAFLPSDMQNPTRKKKGPDVWSYPETQSGHGGMLIPGTFAYGSASAYGPGAGVSEDSTWYCIWGSQVGCYPPDADGSFNSLTINGGFTASAGSPNQNMGMPNCGLTNVVIGIGNGVLQ